MTDISRIVDRLDKLNTRMSILIEILDEGLSLAKEWIEVVDELEEKVGIKKHKKGNVQ